MNPRWLRALDPKSAARYEIARHPLGRWEVLQHKRQKHRPERDRLVQAPGRQRFGDVHLPPIRPWVAPPLITIDGAAVQAIWGVNEYRPRVAVPPPDRHA